MNRHTAFREYSFSSASVRASTNSRRRLGSAMMSTIEVSNQDIREEELVKRISGGKKGEVIFQALKTSLDKLPDFI